MIFNKRYSILIVLLIILGLQSCQKSTVEPDGSKYPIIFSSQLTKTVATISDIQRDGFKVYGQLKQVVDDTENTVFTFERDLVYGQSGWDYENPLYWIPGIKYSFYAVYPKDEITINNDDKFIVNEYDINSQQDLLVSTVNTDVVDATTLLPSNSTSVVNFKFDHLLACVVVKVKSEIDGLSINSVKLSGVKDFGNYNGSVWESTNEATIEYTETTDLMKGSDYIDVTGGGILVIPGSTNGVQLNLNNNIKYTANIENPTNWEKGMKYTYTIVIKQNDIIFNEPKVAKWDSDNATGSVIIK